MLAAMGAMTVTTMWSLHLLRNIEEALDEARGLKIDSGTITTVAGTP